MITNRQRPTTRSTAWTIRQTKQGAAVVVPAHAPGTVPWPAAVPASARVRRNPAWASYGPDTGSVILDELDRAEAEEMAAQELAATAAAEHVTAEVEPA